MTVLIWEGCPGHLLGQFLPVWGRGRCGECENLTLAEIPDAQWLGSRTAHVCELLENLHRH